MEPLSGPLAMFYRDNNTVFGTTYLIGVLSCTQQYFAYTNGDQHFSWGKPENQGETHDHPQDAARPSDVRPERKPECRD